MIADKGVKPGPPRTLMQAHEELVRIRPGRDASLAAWLAYYQRSAALYAELAEIDRGHHHECLYWAERERESGEEIAARIRTEGRK
ncbi:MAG: AMED_5909 family protein [Pseudonocardiaceae bacterium]